MNRILFVDDEPAILEGLENRLRRLRGRWTMHFAQSGPEALELLDSLSFDVIVSDMRMPDMDGAALLDAVRQRHPQVIRFMLSGETGPEGPVRGLPVAHQFLSKPCDVGVLEATIDRLLGALSRNGNGRVQTALGLVQSLPALPRLFVELLAELDKPNSEMTAIAAIIERDVAMSARILQLANSAFFANRSPISSIREAVARMGLMAVRSVAFSSAFFRVLTEPGLSRSLSLEEFDRHAQHVAALTRTMLLNPHQVQVALSAAMLHDIGELIIATRLPDAHERCLDLAVEQQRPVCEIENEILGCSHADVGAQLLSLWGLPAPLIHAVAHHHQPSLGDSREFDACGAIHIAEVMVSQLNLSLPPDRFDLQYLIAVGVKDKAESWLDTYIGAEHDV